ncbi:OsmC family protein [Pseudoroseicyclus aestuarii]|uniref:Osmotically inducible protein OsmC n=1 Tax=Pseudoroseicyclus aestuarii TaxID=1795041 RepID=A0A318SQJ1_9RHOB|nr:OsmC family protein [Pseudoroseicyclus aestuarii]PYE84161.1 osmotically inducible protein OsmC [Pseudoroseicyclus aestuarii]
MIEKFGTAIWNGGIKDGSGKISTQTDTLQSAPYGFATRFEGGKDGTNPEELIGSAHAACFAMALSKELGDAGFPPEEIEARSTIYLDQEGGGFAVKRAHLDVKARVPGASQDDFAKAAESTKTGCPISKLLSCEVTMDAQLLG